MIDYVVLAGGALVLLTLYGVVVAKRDRETGRSANHPRRKPLLQDYPPRPTARPPQQHGTTKSPMDSTRSASGAKRDELKRS